MNRCVQIRQILFVYRAVLVLQRSGGRSELWALHVHLGAAINSFVARSGCREQIFASAVSLRHQSRTSQNRMRGKDGWVEQKLRHCPVCSSNLSLHASPFDPSDSSVILSFSQHCLYFSSHLFTVLQSSLSVSFYFPFLFCIYHMFLCLLLKG